MALPTLGDSLVTNIYGTNASDAVSYSIPRISDSVKTRMTTGIFLNIAQKDILERTRRGGTLATNPEGYYTGKIFADKITVIKTNLRVAGPINEQAYNESGTTAVTTFPSAPVSSGAGSFTSGQKITSGIINALIDEINAAGTVCTCNCNYCTCNCNYCTCNCNYACTCNCNYSDEQVKTEIVYM
jgi:hypothetical protein